VFTTCTGSAVFLLNANLRFKEKYGDSTTIAPLKYYGQEILHSTFAMAKMNPLFIAWSNIALGDTMNRPHFLNADASQEI